MSKVFCESEHNYACDRKTISKLFLSLTFSMAISYFILSFALLITELFPSLPDSISLVINDFYTVIVIVLFCIFSKSITPRRPIALSKMTPSRFFMFVIASVPLMIVGSLIGTAFSNLAGIVIGSDVTNAIEVLIDEYPPFLIFISVIIIAPFFEELMFRKLLIDKTSRFGFGFSAFLSGIVFGTFHGNFYQLFYGFLLGVVLAFVYLTYAKLRYCVLLHSLINFMGFVGPLYVTEFASSSNFSLNFLALCYTFFYYMCIPFGIAIILYFLKMLKVKYPFAFDKFSFCLIFKNYGFLSYITLVVILFAFSIFA